MSETEEPTLVVVSESGATADKFPWPWPIYTTELIPVTNASPAICIQEKSIEQSLGLSVLISAAVIIVLLNILLPRWKGKSLWRWLDLVVPVKFLDSTPFRLIYCLVMSTWAADILRNVSDSSQYYRAKDKALLDALDFFVISPSVIILKQTLTYFPILACVDSPVPVIGHTLGFLYTLLMGSHSVYIESISFRGCSSKGHLSTRDMLLSIATHGPVYIIYLIIAGWFFFHAALEAPLVLCTRQKCYQNISPYDKNSNYYAHVQGLFRRRLKWDPYNLKQIRNIHSLWNYLKHGLAFVLPFHPGFSYPLPFLCSLCMALMTVYQLGLSVAYTAVTYTEQLMEYVREFNITVETVERFFPSLKPEVANLFYDAKSLILAFNIMIPLWVHVCFCLAVMFSMYMVQHYHKLLVRASRGDLSFLVTSEPLPSVPYRIAAMMRYSAFQFSYIVLSWMLYMFAMFIIFSIGLVFYFLFKNSQNYGVHVWAWFMVPFMWSGVMHELQLFLCHFVFVEKRQVSGNGNEFIFIRFKSLYQILWYVFYFFNAIYGCTMCFLRVFGMLVFTVVMLFRIDMDVYMRGLEGWDVGFRTFVGYMYIECTNNNAVVRTFIALLQESVNHKSSVKEINLEVSEDGSDSDKDKDANHTGSIQEEHTGSEQAPLLLTASSEVHHKRINKVLRQIRLPRSRQARKRWFVAYTLLRNPSLQALTARSLTAGVENTQQSGNVYDYGTFSKSL